jgi:hypothetical protein
VIKFELEQAELRIVLQVQHAYFCQMASDAQGTETVVGPEDLVACLELELNTPLHGELHKVWTLEPKHGVVAE